RTEAFGLVGLAAALLAVLGLVDDGLRDRGFLTESVKWLLLAGVAAAMAGALRKVLADQRDRPQPYAEATRLLTQLRTVARQLPGATLDPGGIAEHLIEEVRSVARVDRCVVLVASGGGRLVVLAQSGPDRVDWETSLDTDSAIADAWATQQIQVSG